MLMTEVMVLINLIRLSLQQQKIKLFFSLLSWSKFLNKKKSKEYIQKMIYREWERKRNGKDAKILKNDSTQIPTERGREGD